LDSNPDLNTTFGITKPTHQLHKQKLSNIEAISIPTPGESYRPIPEDHQNLLNQVKVKHIQHMERLKRLKLPPKEVNINASIKMKATPMMIPLKNEKKTRLEISFPRECTTIKTTSTTKSKEKKEVEGKSKEKKEVEGKSKEKKVEGKSKEKEVEGKSSSSTKNHYSSKLSKTIRNRMRKKKGIGKKIENSTFFTKKNG